MSPEREDLGRRGGGGGILSLQDPSAVQKLFSVKIFKARSSPAGKKMKFKKERNKQLLGHICWINISPEQVDLCKRKKNDQRRKK